MDVVFSEDKSFSLTKLDDRLVPQDLSEIRLFCNQRNELTRLPFFLDYYRKLGVGRFFFIDDRSEDGSREYLLSQGDVHVFQPSNTFKEAKAGVRWHNALMAHYGDGHWVIGADVDEILVYPYCEKVGLRDFCRYLESEGSSMFFSLVMDMYPEGRLSRAVCVPGKPFFEICPCFDKDYTFREKSGMSSKPNEFPRIRIAGGPRARTFYPFQTRVDFISRMLVTLAVRAANKMTFWKGDKPHYAPAMIKMPLVKWERGFERLSNHVVRAPEGKKISPMTGAVLHFKFFADVQERTIQEIARNQHFSGSQEYRRYLIYCRENPDPSFVYEGTRRFTGSESLLREKLVSTTPDYERHARSVA